MSKIGDALKRKWGPLPAWVWLLGGGLIYYFYRRYSSVSSGTGTGSVAPAAPTPQAPVVLSPGESVYDPNSGALTNTPQASNPATVGGGDGSGSSPPDWNTIAGDIAAAIAANMPANQTGVDTSTQSPANSPAGIPAGATALPMNLRPGAPRLTATGAIRAPFGHNKPRGKAGYTIKGLGRGFWEYVPKRHPKSKGQHNAQAKTSKPIKPGRTTRPRSTTALRSAPAGGRTSARSPARHTVTVNRSVSTRQQPSRARQHPRQPGVQQVVSQRRPATMPRQSPTRQTGGVAPRPSAPPPRTHRAPAPPPPPRRRRRGTVRGGG